MKALKVTISGSYKTSQGEIVDFEDVSGVVPFVEEEYAAMHVRGRYVAVWVKSAVKKDGEKLYTDRIEHVRQVFIDDMEEVEHDFTYVGKNIKEMTYEELQDLATAKDLRYIPLPKSQSGLDVREARMRAYLAYSEKVVNNFIDVKDPPPAYCDETKNPDGSSSFALNLSKMPALVVDGEVRVEISSKITNDEIIQQEQDNAMGKPKENLTLEDLKDIADKKNIKYHWNIGFDKLYAMLYGGAVA